MNVYLDIDGVLIGSASPLSDVKELLLFILAHFPQSTYWLTTHCQHGVNRSAEWLKANHFPCDIIDRLGPVIKPTDWDTLKTEAIDFSTPFIWFDDALLYSEIEVLKQHNSLNCVFLMNKNDSRMAASALEHLKKILCI